MAEDIIFRGSSLELRVRLHDILLSVNRSINDAPIEIGETVDVFIHRLYIIDGEKITLRSNSSIRSESVAIEAENDRLHLVEPVIFMYLSFSIRNRKNDTEAAGYS